MADPLSLPFDHYERYRLSCDLVGRVVGSVPQRVLDVGGHFGSWKLFRPQDHVTAVDPQSPPAFTYRPDIPFIVDRYVRALGGALPFRDGVFDVVGAHDTVEHVPPEERNRFLGDLARTTRKLVILNGPVRSTEAENAEARIRRMWTATLGEHDHALAEHARWGLPDANALSDHLRRLGLEVVSVPNGNIALWLSMMVAKTYLQGLPDGDDAHAALDRAFNALLAADDIREPCYRVAFVGAPKGDPAIAELGAGLRSVSARRGTDFSPLERLAEALDAHLGRLREVIATLWNDIERVNEEALRRGARIDELEARVTELEARRGPEPDPGEGGPRGV